MARFGGMIGALVLVGAFGGGGGCASAPRGVEPPRTRHHVRRAAERLPVHGDVGHLRPRVGQRVTLQGEPFGGKVPNRLRLVGGGFIHLARPLPEELQGKPVRLSGVLHEGQAVHDPNPAKRFELGGYTPAYPEATQPLRYIYLYLYDYAVDSVWDGGQWNSDGRQLR